MKMILPVLTSNKMIRISMLAVCFLGLTSMAYGQACCRGLNFNDFQTYCVITGGAGSCSVGTTCTTGVLDAAYGITGAWNAGVACVTGSGPDGICTNVDCGVLPVELVEFELVLIENGIQLYWTTASETNNEGFEIERSTDGLNWETIDFVEGEGSSIDWSHYDYLDKSPALGFNYYRLKQVDYDETFDYSPVKVSVWQGSDDPGKMQLAVLPNPATDWVTVGLTGQMTLHGDIQFDIFDQTGRLVRSILRDKNDDIRISLDGLASGFYMIHARQGQVREVARFLKK